MPLIVTGQSPARPAGGPPSPPGPSASLERARTADPRDKAAAAQLFQGDFTHQRRLLEEGLPITVHGSHGRTYIIQKREGFYSCTCPLWRHQAVDGVPKEKRRWFKRFAPMPELRRCGC